MRFIFSAFVLLAFAAPAFAADEKVDIMNPYVKQQQKVVERTLADNEKYLERWYKHVEERYGIKADELKEDKASEEADKAGDDAKADEDGAEEVDASTAEDNKKTRAAILLLRDYRNLEAAFDPAIKDLYADDAEIRIILVHQSGTKKRLSATLLKDRMEEAMERDNKLGFKRSFNDVKYFVEGKGVRIKAITTYSRARYNRSFTGPWQILVEPDKDGKWVITEEVIYLPSTPN